MGTCASCKHNWLANRKKLFKQISIAHSIYGWNECFKERSITIIYKFGYYFRPNFQLSVFSVHEHIEEVKSLREAEQKNNIVLHITIQFVPNNFHLRNCEQFNTYYSDSSNSSNCLFMISSKGFLLTSSMLPPMHHM